jgi:hypothetical protein
MFVVHTKYRHALVFTSPTCRRLTPQKKAAVDRRLRRLDEAPRCHNDDERRLMLNAQLRRFHSRAHGRVSSSAWRGVGVEAAGGG